ncbi:protein FAM151B [Coturnix japonica]|uniref:Family with sequence similarity 151 member B n=1 Tax=Coturnix japonica TaxID=93934 RepID=A0A8C2SQS2_COTJA|nr:protein FAM151B [Coturnix japonica]
MAAEQSGAARSEAAVDQLVQAGRRAGRDAAEIRWWHAANSRHRARQAARSAVHMVEADVLLRGGTGGGGEPIMAHPPDTDSDITLREWLEEMVGTDKGIKLDFKSLDAIQPSLELLQLVKPCLERPVWLNADILPGPNGINAVVDAKGFLDAHPTDTTPIRFSHNRRYRAMVKEMAQICSALSQPVTFPVRAVLVRQSVSELRWLIDQSDRYSLTVWTGKQDVYSVDDLLFIRENFDKSRVYYDISEPQNSEFKKAIGIGC